MSMHYYGPRLIATRLFPWKKAKHPCRSKNPTKTMKLSDVEGCLASLVDAISRQETRVLIESEGVPIAVLVSIEDLQRLTTFEREQAKRFAIIDHMREAFADVPPEQIEQDVVDIIRELREKDEAALRAEEETAGERRPA
jgi:PHD/YefM family antitoxin component YafN of YafNO toxin-antitoxin module